MTITPTIMYWFTRLDGFNVFFGISCFILGFSLAITIVCFLATSDPNGCDQHAHAVSKTMLKWLVPTWLVCVIGLLFTPTTKEMAMIYVVPRITESQIIKQDLPELYDLGINALKDVLKKHTKHTEN